MHELPTNEDIITTLQPAPDGMKWCVFRCMDMDPGGLAMFVGMLLYRPHTGYRSIVMGVAEAYRVRSTSLVDTAPLPWPTGDDNYLTTLEPPDFAEASEEDTDTRGAQ